MLKKRVLWVLNHDTLSKFELPLIHELGFEIFTPKIVPKNTLQQSGSVTYEYDTTLSIPEQDLKILNEYNFYENEEMPFIIRHLINKYFDTAIVMFDFYALNKLVDNFKGNIFARAFGLGKAITYREITEHVFGPEYFYKLETIKDRFWFSHCYESIVDIETGIYKEKSVFMPLGLPDDFYTVSDQWVGNTNKLLFFCTRINFNAESNGIYKKFKKDFKGLDYVIAGNQPVPVDDPNVTGFLEREEINDLFTGCKVMFYHSTYPRHLHYHPLEAMIAGMPVLYLQGGLLNKLGGERQSGCCKNISEARNKIQRIFDGDTKLIEEIREDQKKILHYFSFQYNKMSWEQNFIPILERKNKDSSEKSVTIATFIAEKQSKQHIQDYVALFKALDEGLKAVNQQHKLIFNVHSNEYNIDHDFSDLLYNSVDVREYSLQTLDTQEINDIYALMFKNKEVWYEKYVIPTDKAQNYADVDFWLFFYKEFEQPIASIKPYGLFIDNLNERYFETINNICISNIKNAAFIFTNSAQTKEDLITYLGINSLQIMIIPFVYSNLNLSMDTSNQAEDHILIEANLKYPTHVTKILDDIIDYYKLYRADEKIIINFDNYNDKKAAHFYDEISKAVKKNNIIKDKVLLYAGIGENQYNVLYKFAKKIIFPHHIDNVQYKLARAAFFSKPVVLDNYPFYNEIEQQIGGQFQYKNFALNKNALIEVLSESDEMKLGTNKAKLLPDVNTELLSDVWRKLL
ncbi:hypothetical protein ABEW34_15375 [Paenibacillus algorifonticola]|uniref:hypothetical protein n=1 Tax=Paenibacillus algorifonticola TaxID=684063 RepID=UPI003D2995B1